MSHDTRTGQASCKQELMTKPAWQRRQARHAPITEYRHQIKDEAGEDNVIGCVHASYTNENKNKKNNFPHQKQIQNKTKNQSKCNTNSSIVKYSSTFFLTGYFNIIIDIA